jgi:hypothetical protein
MPESIFAPNGNELNDRLDDLSARRRRSRLEAVSACPKSLPFHDGFDLVVGGQNQVHKLHRPLGKRHGARFSRSV